MLLKVIGKYLSSTAASKPLRCTGSGLRGLALARTLVCASRPLLSGSASHAPALWVCLALFGLGPGCVRLKMLVERNAVEAVEALLDRRSDGPPPRDRSRLARHRSALEKVRTLRGIGGST